ncbi:DNA polymerase IV 2 [Listeria floridensis FSL S10-1187]|uniref:DNA polymerase IV 2 n=1 Tax=Listeria floridensis FSL S10-1187 TaxID=1265817 RepID=A0ABP3AXK4_9LIST|nr:DNA polymerase IV 2 [Listeria floridensis FSL S10-1187]
MTGSHALFGDTLTIAKRIQQDILDELGLYVTVGIGDNLLMAKLALDNAAKHQADGIAEWRYADIPETLWKINELTDFWGIGSRMAKRLYALGIYDIFDLSQAPESLLKHHLGVIGSQLYYHAHGLDFSKINEKYVPTEKSYGKSQILDRDYQDPVEVTIIIQEMAEEIAMRLRTSGVDTATIFLHVGYSRFSTLRGFRHQMKIQPTNSSRVIKQTLMTMFWKYYQDEPVRSIMITCGSITPKNGLQLNLFEDLERSYKSSNSIQP